MTFHPLSSLFNKTRISWDETDLKYFVQEYLRGQIKTDRLYCRRVENGRVLVCVDSPAANQTVRLLEYELRQILKRQAGYVLKQLTVWYL